MKEGKTNAVRLELFWLEPASLVIDKDRWRWSGHVEHTDDVNESGDVW